MIAVGAVRRLVRFFFSSRRRHTRFDCDWSSDVCSSDLGLDGFHAHCDAPQTAGLLPEQSHPDQILRGVRPNSPPLLADICDDTLDIGYWDIDAPPTSSHRLPATLLPCAFCGELPTKLPHSIHTSQGKVSAPRGGRLLA